ncbi:MAG: M24 family metallopeptidase [Chloroflexi bacterium]|nr:M24 family metallopeptidase [Chloroflexota bacterium]
MNVEDRLRGENPWATDIRVGASGAALVEVLREKGFDGATVGVVGLERGGGGGEPEGVVPHMTWSHVLKHLPRAVFVDVSAEFLELTAVKSEEELELVRRAAHIGEMACQAMLKATRPGTSESEIYGTVLRVIFSNGAKAEGPGLILHSGVDNLSWGPPTWIHRAQRPRSVQKGELVQAEIFSTYGGMETQQQMSVALKPVHPVNAECAAVARRSYQAGLNALRPGKKFREVVEAMEMPLVEAGCWHTTPLIHSLNPILTVSPTMVRVELAGELPGFDEKYLQKYKYKRTEPTGGNTVIKPGTVFELEANACRGKHRVNLGGTVIVNEDRAEALNTLSTEMRVKK